MKRKIFLPAPQKAPTSARHHRDVTDLRVSSNTHTSHFRIAARSCSARDSLGDIVAESQRAICAASSARPSAVYKPLSSWLCDTNTTIDSSLVALHPPSCHGSWVAQRGSALPQ